MKTYKVHVTGIVGRHLTIQAENQETAEIEAKREFSALVGTVDDGDAEVVDIDRIDDE